MEPCPNGSPLPGPPASPTPFRLAATLLLEAFDFAAELGCDPWDFAVEIAELRSAGLSNNALRWLLGKGFVRHATEVTDPATAARAFRPSAALALAPTTCFVLTEAGVGFALHQATPRSRPPDLVPPPPGVPAVPVWDCDRQELRLGRAVVKRFKVPAPNQEVILAAFQEEGWPVRIDDPLTPLPGQDAKRRLHETITSLNRNQKCCLLSFHGDGSGEGVLWEPLRGPVS
jgi:hypothetical protein